MKLFRFFLHGDMDKIIKVRKVNIYFPLQVWFSSVVIVAPLMLLLYSGITDPSIFSDFYYYELYGLFAILGLIYSLPTLLFCYFIFFLIVGKTDSPVFIRFWFDVICIAGIAGTFYVIDAVADSYYIPFYACCVIVSSLLFRVFKRVNTSED